MASYINTAGETQTVQPSVGWYQEAASAGLSLEQYINSTYQTDINRHGTPYQQILASEGVVLHANREFGLTPTRVSDMMKAGVEVMAGAITKNTDGGVAALRVLFPMVVMSAIEATLAKNLQNNIQVFDSLVAINDTIYGDKFERPILDIKSPGRAKAISQLSEPQTMVSITTSSISRTIPTKSIGLLISDQAQTAINIDLVALMLAKQKTEEAYFNANDYLLSFLNGDADVAMASLASLGYTVASNVLDTASPAGVLTQKAWLKFLTRNSNKRVIDTIVTDLDTAMKIEGRTGKPVITGDNPNSPRIDTLMTVANANWTANVRVFLTDDPNWPANTIMGLDTRFGVHRVNSSTAQYEAVEEFVLRRGKGLRFDYGEIAYRLFDDAFDVLVIV